MKIMTTVNIVYDRKNLHREQAPIEIRITHDRRSLYINTGVRVRREQFAYDRIVNHPQAEELNERINILLQRTIEAVNARLKDKREISVAEIKREIENGTSNSVLAWIKTEAKQINIKPGTAKHYVTLQTRLDEFGGIQTWQDVTVANIYAFDAWLRELPGKRTKMSEAGRYNYHKCLRSLLNRAVKMELLTANPYAKMRGEIGKGERENMEYLADTEIEKLLKFSPCEGSELAHARDLFVFQMFTGLSYSDAQAFDFSAYKKVRGTYRLTAERIKTGVPFVSQLLPPAVEILEKYGWRVPRMSNQAYNRALKQVATAAGLSVRLHSHLARHTFATYMLSNGVAIENLSKMLGHTNITRTQRYAKVLAESVHSDFEMIARKMKKKNAKA